MPDNTVSILLKTTADVSGVEKLNSILGHVQKSEQALAQATKAVTQETKLQADAMKRLGEAAERTQKFFQPAAINPWVTASGNAAKNVEALAQSQNKAAGSSTNMGNAMLQASRGLQDMQYGLAGAVNNLEGIASALGLGAGVAGVVTVLAVAVQTLGPTVVNWLKSLDTEGKKLDDLKEALGRASDAIKGEYKSNTENAKTNSENFAEALKKEADAIDATITSLDNKLTKLKQVSDIQKTADQLKEESDIADIKAQKLAPDQEKAAIATRKRETLDAEKARQDQAAKAALETSADKLNAGAANRNELQHKQASLEQEKANALAYQSKLAEQKKLEDEKRKADSEASRVETEVGYVPDAFKEAQAKANKNLEQNKAAQKAMIAQAPEGRIRGVDEIQGQLDQVKPQAKAAADQVARDAEALKVQAEAERIAKVGRDNEYQRAAEKIAREAQGGMFDAGNLKPLPPALGEVSAPLPPPAAPGSILPPKPEGFGAQELNPQRLPVTGAPGTYGPQGQTPAQAGSAEVDMENGSADRFNQQPGEKKIDWVKRMLKYSEKHNLPDATQGNRGELERLQNNPEEANQIKVPAVAAQPEQGNNGQAVNGTAPANNEGSSKQSADASAEMAKAAQALAEQTAANNAAILKAMQQMLADSKKTQDQIQNMRTATA